MGVGKQLEPYRVVKFSNQVGTHATNSLDLLDTQFYEPEIGMGALGVVGAGWRGHAERKDCIERPGACRTACRR